MQKYDIVVSKDQGLEQNNGYVAISSPFKLPQIYFLNTMRGVLSFKSLSQVIQHEVMTLVYIISYCIIW